MARARVQHLSEGRLFYEQTQGLGKFLAGELSFRICSTGPANLQFQGPCQIQFADNLGRSGVPRELHNKTLLVRKVCWIKFTAVWYKPRVSSKTNRRAPLKCDNQVFEQLYYLIFKNSTSWLKSPHHSGFRFAFRRSFRVSSSTEQAVTVAYRLRESCEIDEYQRSTLENA